VDPTTLQPVASVDKGGAFLLGAIRLGKTRLIDNLYFRARLGAGPKKPKKRAHR